MATGIIHDDWMSLKEIEESRPPLPLRVADIKYYTDAVGLNWMRVNFELLINGKTAAGRRSTEY